MESVNTKCPKCRKDVVTRKGHTVTGKHVINGNCGFCGSKIAGRWQ